MISLPKLPISNVREVRGTVYLAGEVPIDAEGNVPVGIRLQTQLVLEKIGATLAAEGMTPNDVVQVLVHLTDPADFHDFNAVYGNFFSEPWPTRTTVVAGLLLPGARVEVTVQAARKQ